MGKVHRDTVCKWVPIIARMIERIYSYFATSVQGVVHRETEAKPVLRKKLMAMCDVELLRVKTQLQRLVGDLLTCAKSLLTLRTFHVEQVEGEELAERIIRVASTFLEEVAAPQMLDNVLHAVNLKLIDGFIERLEGDVVPAIRWEAKTQEDLEALLAPDATIVERREKLQIRLAELELRRDELYALRASMGSSGSSFSSDQFDNSLLDDAAEFAAPSFRAAESDFAPVSGGVGGGSALRRRPTLPSVASSIAGALSMGVF